MKNKCSYLVLLAYLSLYFSINLAIAFSQQIEILHLNCLYTKSEIKILNTYKKTSQVQIPDALEQGDYTLLIFNKKDSILFSKYFNIPNKIFYDYEENGILHGGIVLNDSVEFNIEMPYNQDNHTLKIVDQNNNLIVKEKISKSFLNIPVDKNKSVSRFSLAYPFTTIFFSGNPNNRINIVFLGDGYTNLKELFTDAIPNGKWDGDQFIDLNSNGVLDQSEPYSDENKNGKYDKGEQYIDQNVDRIYNSGEQEKYRADVSDMVNYIFSSSVIGNYKNHINIYRIDSIFSEQAGADHLYPAIPLYRNTALNSSYSKSIERLLTTDYSKVNSIVRSSIPELGSRYYVIVMVNCFKYGGSGGTTAVSYNGSSGPEVMIHEFGHTFPNLADEYYYTNDSNYALYRGTEPSAPNVSKETVRTKIKWNSWIPATTQIPTPISNDGMGLFEGSMYYEKGLYRPKNNCKMRILNVPFCSVCTESILKSFYSSDNTIDEFAPMVDTVKTSNDASISFTVNTIKPNPNTLHIIWTLNNSVSNFKGESISISKNILDTLKMVEVSIFDTTDLVRNDSKKILRKKRTWIIKKIVSEIQSGTKENTQFALYQNFPNPFNPLTLISFNIPNDSHVDLTIYDIFGRKIENLISKNLYSGMHKIEWNASKLSSGLYICQLKSGQFLGIKKMLLLR